MPIYNHFLLSEAGNTNIKIISSHKDKNIWQVNILWDILVFHILYIFS